MDLDYLPINKKMLEQNCNVPFTLQGGRLADQLCCRFFGSLK